MFLRAAARPIMARPCVVAAPRVARPVGPVMAAPVARTFHYSAYFAAKTAKGASGKKKKGKQEEELPKDLNMDKIATDWSKWQHGDKRDVTLEFKDGAEPDWLKEILATADKNGLLQVHKHFLFPIFSCLLGPRDLILLAFSYFWKI